MEIKMFYKTQREIAEIINELVDSYWENGIDEAELVLHLKNLFSNNSSKILKNEQFTTILKQHCGKRRLEVVEAIIKMSEGK